LFTVITPNSVKAQICSGSARHFKSLSQDTGQIEASFGLWWQACHAWHFHPTSKHRCEDLGLDYVSCSPFRVPIARLSAAQAAIKARGAGHRLHITEVTQGARVSV
jgi:hypothetical protein